MEKFVHLHVHTQYSILDGQASVPRLVDKAIKDGMVGMAVTDHGNMMGIKEFFNYVRKLKGKARADLAAAESKIAAGEDADGGQRKIAEAKRRVLDFKPIFGCEMYVARRGKTRKEAREDQSGWHLVVLAKNEKGYHNLLKLVSRAWTEGFYMRPRTDHEDLERYKEGLIVCTACLGGEIPQKILHGRREEAAEAVRWFKSVFGDDYYLELQRHEVTDPAIRANRETYPEQQRVNAVLAELGREYGVKLICTNDSHFVDEEDAEAHDRLICLSTGHFLDDTDRMLYTKQEWFKTQAEMNAVFSDMPEALANTLEICAKVEEYSIDHEPIMPNFDIPADFGTEAAYREKFSEEDLYEEFTRDEKGNVVMTREEGEQRIKKLGGYERLYRIKLEADYLRKLTYERATEVYPTPLPDEVKERLDFELHVMKTMGFPGYFLIVQDYICAAREELDVIVGPGRGSAAGSAVAYCLGITRIDPIKYDLLFERFLNPDRISLPDIDVDFDDDGRARVLDWVTRKYGEEKVAHIITYGAMATKSALRDVGRVQQVPREVVNRLCKLIPDHLPPGPDGKEPPMSLRNAIAAIPELKEAETSKDTRLHDTIRYAKELEGNIRNTGVHACGVIISRDDISDWVPVSTVDDKCSKERVRCTQYEGSVIEETGLIKMDFLGLKTLSIIKDAVEDIKMGLGIKLNIDKIPIDDEATYKLFCDGRTTGTFQFESAGMQKYLKELQPSTFEDLIAMNALYRPGPMQYIPQFIARKQGAESITYDLPCMEKYLKDTYGITVYQEQVMLLSRVIANFTRGESDTLRKAMGKKLIDKLNQMYPQFIAGGKANGYDEKVLEKIWNDWRAFASYAFNKSHATCYSWVAYQTAYLKANFPAQYMAAAVSRNLHDKKEVGKLMDECKAMNIKVLGPDINESYLKFSVNQHGAIRFGLGAISGINRNAVDAIVNARREHGPFRSVFDFMERVNLKICTSKNLESLVLAGAFDCFPDIRRDQYFAKNDKDETFIESLYRYGIRYQEEKSMEQNSLFGEMEEVEIIHPVPPAQYTGWSDTERLKKEYDLLGIYISGHPLDEYAVVLKNMCTAHCTDLANLELLTDKEITFGGIVTSCREEQTRNGKPYGSVKMEDYEGIGEFRLFGDEWTKWRNYLMGVGNFLYVTARAEPNRMREGSYDLRIGKVEFLADVKAKGVKKLTITVHLEEIDEMSVTDLAALVKASPGPTELFFNIVDLENQSHITLQAPQKSLTVKKSLIDHLEESPAFEYRIN